WREYANVVDTSAPEFQNIMNIIAGLNQQLQAQHSLFMTPAQMAEGTAQTAQRMIDSMGTHGAAGTMEQELIGPGGVADQQIDQAIGNLKGYMTQVHDAHRQERQETADYNLQMNHMYRDFNRQQAEALYQRNLQVTEANYQFNEQLRQMSFQTADAFGKAYQQVQAQYTVSAGTALAGMRNQVDLLQRSKHAMDQLHAMGLSRNAIRLSGLDDPTNVAQAERDVIDFAGNPALIRAWNKSFAKRLKISKGIDTDLNNAQFADMKRQFDP